VNIRLLPAKADCSRMAKHFCEILKLSVFNPFVTEYNLPT